jgi:ATP-dependent Lon protease
LRWLSIDARLLPQAPQKLIVALDRTEPARADLAASSLVIKPKERLEILESVDPVAHRQGRAASLRAHRDLALSNEIGLQAKTTFVERERKAGLRGQMAMIQRDLGEGGGKAHEVAELAQAITTVNMRRRRNASC